MALSPHYHSGRFLAHHHTSYAGLGILLLVVGVLLVGVTGFTLADQSGGDFAVQAAVVLPPPTTAPVITTPGNGQHFTNSPIDVRGTCEPGLIVEVYKNDVLTGSVLCDSTGRFGLKSDLFIGLNALIARHTDITNQAGPDSNPVSVSYDVASVPFSITAVSSEIGAKGNVIIKSDRAYQGTVPGTALTWNLEVLGGTAPYAVSIDWGDGQTDLFSRKSDGQFSVSHTYQKAGGYKGGYVIAIRAVDAQGVTGILQMVALVNTPVGTATTTTTTPTPTIPGWWKLVVGWPLWVFALVTLLSFWLGERRQRYDDDRRRPMFPVASA